MSRFKLIMTAILVASGLIIVLQNTEPVSTRLLFFTITMPRAVLLFGTGCIGFTLGILVSFFFHQESKNKDNHPDRPPPI